MSLVWYKVLPAKFGGQQTIAAFNNELAKHVELVCLCSRDNEPSGNEQYTVIANLPVTKAQFVNPLTWKKIVEVAKREQITHIIIEHPYHAVASWICKKRLGCKIIHYSHNIEYKRFKSLKRWYWWPIKKIEFWLSGFADVNVCVTREDIQWLIEKARVKESNTYFLPHTISRKDLTAKGAARELIGTRHNISASQKLFLFNGTLDYHPNFEAVRYICNIIAPQFPKRFNNSVIVITGRCKTIKLQIPVSVSQHVIYAGEVEDVEAYFLAADAYINPVTTGEGVQTKTLEALSYNLSVVCWHNMLRGIEPGLVKQKLLVASTGEEFLERMIASLQQENVISDAFFSFYSYEQHFPSFLNKLKQL